MTRQERARRIQEILDGLYPAVDIPLDHADPFTLLVAVVLSAQTTDKLVNQVTPALFARASTPEAMAALPVEEIQHADPPDRARRGKAKNLKRLSEILVAEHGGQVPRTLRGAGGPARGRPQDRLGGAQPGLRPPGLPGGHPHPPAGRPLGLSSGKNVEQTERDLKRLFPEETWGKVHLQIIYFGREHCPALYHDLDACPICSWAASGKRKREEHGEEAEAWVKTPG